VEKVISECRKVIVGQEGLLGRLVLALLCRGHVLLEGLPGLAKTRAVKTLGQATRLLFRRVQFTPDLLPSDVTGTLIYDPRNLTFTPRKGPIFANLLLADEINRAPSKVQSALLEAMEERQATIGDDSFPLPEPFLVLATQNPIEQEGTFPLPEAQMDRFLFKLKVGYPSAQEEIEILRRDDAGEEPVRPVIDAGEIAAACQKAHAVKIDEAIRAYIVRIVQETRLGAGRQWKGKELLRCGASPRAALALQAASKALAHLSGRNYVLPDDVVSLVPDVLRHRLILTLEAEADAVDVEQVIKALMASVPRP
jgi:MoxR-like ATPase